MFANLALAVEEHWSCVETTRYSVFQDGSASDFGAPNDSETLRWLDKDTIQLRVPKYVRSEKSRNTFINNIGAVYTKTNERQYLVIFFEPTHAGNSTKFGHLLVW